MPAGNSGSASIDDFRPHIGKGFIDDQPPSVRRPGPRESREVGARDDAAVRIVGIDHDQGFQILPVRIRQCGELVHLGTGVTPGRGMRTIGRREDANAASADHARQQPDRDLAAGNRQHRGVGGKPVGSRRGRGHFRDLAGKRQALIARQRDMAGTGHGIGLIPVDRSIQGFGADG